MIYNLQNQIVALLRSGLAGAVTNPLTQIIHGIPSGNLRPLIAVYGGDLRMGTQAADFSSSQPRPMELVEEFPVLAVTPEGPYALAKTPLEGSALGRLVYNQGGLNERRKLVLEHKDFSIDYTTAQLMLQTDLSEVSHIQLTYNFVGIFFMQEFNQELFIEVLSPDPAIVERLSSLSGSIVFTHHDELIQTYNQTSRTIYSANVYLSEHWIGRLAWIDSHADYVGTTPGVKMRFQVSGQLKHIRADLAGFGLIEKIHTPGTSATEGVNIEPELG